MNLGSHGLSREFNESQAPHA